MWSASKRFHCLWSSLLIVTCAGCITVLYLYVAYVGTRGVTEGSSRENVIQAEKQTDEDCIPVCDSKACIWHANMLLRNMNATVSPCDNFRTFLCGGYEEKFVPEETGDIITDSKTTLFNALKGILDNEGAQPGSAFKKMKIVYDSCINYGSSELRGITDFKSFLNDIGLSNWPKLSQDFNFFNMSLYRVLGKLKAYGEMNYIHFIYKFRDDERKEEDKISIKVSYQNYFFEKESKIPREVGIQILNYFHLEPEDIETILNDYEFVKNFILDLNKNVTDCDDNCTNVSVDCLAHENDDWLHFCEVFETFLDVRNITDQFSKRSVNISGENKEFLLGLFRYLHSLRNRSLANFFALNFLWKHQTEINFYFRLSKLNSQLKYSETESYAEPIEIDRSRYCIRWIAENMRIALANEFFQQYLTKEISDEIVQLFNDYRSDLAHIVALQEWLPSPNKLKAENQLRNLSFNIYNLKQMLPNDTFVNEYYKMFNPTTESFFQNVLKLPKAIPFPYLFARTEQDYAVFITNFEVQASADGTEIDIHYGMLLPPFFIPGHNRLINRNLLSTIIGHEFGHTILFEWGGLPMPYNNTLAEKKQCIENHMSKFKFKILNENLNGSRYNVESFADNVVTTLIDESVEKYHSPDEDILLPGLPYTTKQLSFMSASQMWCSKSNLKEEIHYQTENSHAPSEFRLLSVLQNSRTYPEIFNCPAGSYMNPQTKCALLERK